MFCTAEHAAAKLRKIASPWQRAETWTSFVAMRRPTWETSALRVTHDADVTAETSALRVTHDARGDVSLAALAFSLTPPLFLSLSSPHHMKTAPDRGKLPGHSGDGPALGVTSRMRARHRGGRTGL